MKNAIDIIRAEHRALAAVLSALQAYVDGLAGNRYAADYDLIADMIEYVTEVPEQVHHPREDDYLFAALRKRSPEAVAIIDGLQQEHRIGPAKLADLSHALDAFRKAGPPGLPAFRAAVKAYFEFEWQHMSKEEREIIPLARASLLPEDWAAIDSAFAANDNPWEGPEGKFRALFTRIVSIAPAPIGVGDGKHPV